MHLSVPIPRFIWGTSSEVSYKINFDGGNTTCPDGGDCTYTWDFGDGSCTAVPVPDECTGIVTSHTYTSTLPQTVKLTVDTAGTYRTSAYTSRSVIPAVVNQPPTAVGLSSAAISNFRVTFTDASTDPIQNDPNGITTVTVTWGDGSQSTGAVGAAFSRTYSTAGTYTILHTATDAAGLSNTEKLTVSVPQKFSITGTVTRSGTGLAGVTMILKLNTTTKATTTTAGDGTYTFGNVLPGTYVVQPFKSGSTFSPATRTVTVGPNAANVNFTAAL
jgi:hypothetical protein